MSSMLTFISGVLAGFMAHVCGAIIFLWLHRRWIPSLKELRRMVASLWREMLATGGIAFYTNRHNLRRLLGPISQYVGEASRTLEYYGIQFYTLEDDGAIHGIKRLIEQNGRFSCYLLRPESPLLPYYARLLSRSEALLRQQLGETAKKLLDFKKALPSDARDRFRVYVHDELLTASYFVFDAAEARGKFLIDHKLFAGERSMSYGFEIYSKEHPLFCAAKLSVASIQKLSTELQ